MSMTPPGLFEHARQERLKKEAPLAARMRPRTLQEYIGQNHLLAPGRLLRRAIQADRLSSLIFYGPPGTGKTTLASVIANTTRSAFVTLNAVMAGLADLKGVTAEAQRKQGEYGQRTILFIDEVHRWNRAQQDALLPWVENGTVILIGATTENPYFTVNRALVSRSRVFQLKPLDGEEVRQVMRQALEDPERGYGKLSVVMEPEAMEHLANVANGDARAALNALELAVETTPPGEDGAIHVTLAVAEESIQRRAVLYDREGDCHFDTISAFIKSMRGSDPDAVFYWLAKMVYAGEDPRFIFRRMLIFASEDIGMADPHAVPFVQSCAEAFDRVGLPEGHFPLAHAALYCATAPKSNSVLGFFDALKLVEKEREGEVPNHLRDASRDQKGFGHGVGYRYPHEYRDHWVAQQYLPTSLQGRIFYQPGNLGYESTLADQIRRRRELQLAALRERTQCPPQEILTFSPVEKRSEQWLARTVDSLAGFLARLRQELFQRHPLQRHERVLDLTADSGLLTWEAVRRTPEGGVWALVRTPEARQFLLEEAANLPDLRRPQVLVGTLEELPDLLQRQGQADLRFDLILGRNALGRLPQRQKALRILASLLEPQGGTLALAETLPRRGQRLSQLLDHPPLPPEIPEAEERLYQKKDDPLLDWDEEELLQDAQAAGLLQPRTALLESQRTQLLPPQVLERWLDPQQPGSYAQRLLDTGLSPALLREFARAMGTLAGKTVTIHSMVALLEAHANKEDRS